MYGHISKLAEAEKEGLKKAGIEADIYQYVVIIHLNFAIMVDSPTGLPRLFHRRS
jgi:hypothetical protein